MFLCVKVKNLASMYKTGRMNKGWSTWSGILSWIFAPGITSSGSQKRLSTRLHIPFNDSHWENPLIATLYLLVRVHLWHQNNCLHMERYVLIDVSFLEPIQTNMKCSKISPFVCRNISTNSVAKKYWYNSLSISQSEPRLPTEKVQLFYSFLLL